MIKATLDTNVLVSAAIVKGNEYEILKLAKLGKIKLILSLDILKEFKEVISREKFGFSSLIVDEIVKNILNISEIVVTKEKLDIIKMDSDDNRILECALAGNVDYIISGDNHLLNLKEFRSIKIVRASEIKNKFGKFIID